MKIEIFMSNKIKFIYEYLLFFLWYLWNKSRDRQTGIIMFSSILLFCGGHLQQLFVKLFLIYFHFISMFVSIYFLFLSYHFNYFLHNFSFLFLISNFLSSFLKIISTNKNWNHVLYVLYVLSDAVQRVDDDQMKTKSVD